MRTTNLLFVYGTLLQANNEFGNYLQQHSTFITAGCFKGNLYDLGDYPAAVYNDNATTYVYGSVVQIADEAVLTCIDSYEGLGQPGCEYSREALVIKTNLGEKLCWVYLYILPEDRLKLIAGGNYMEYLKTL